MQHSPQPQLLTLLMCLGQAVKVQLQLPQHLVHQQFPHHCGQHLQLHSNMAAYINIITREYPFYPGDMELRFPNFDENNVHEDYAVVLQPDLPEHTDTQKVDEIAPSLIDGVWTKQYAVIDLTQEELNMRTHSGRNSTQDLTQSGSAPNVIE
jgi:hypothetical protein